MSTLADIPPLRSAAIFFLRFRKAGKSTFLIAALNPLCVLGAMGLGLGSLIDKGSTTALGGVDYLSFIAPGLMAAFAMQGAAVESLWPVLGGIMWDGTYVAMVATPLRPIDVMLGQLSFIAMRITIGIVMTFGAMLVFGAVQSPWGVLTMPAALLTGLAYSSMIMAFSATRKDDTAFPLVMRFGVLPSYLFSGTFFPITQLPTALQAFAKVTPLWHGVDLCRSLSLGEATPLRSIGHVVYLSVFVAVALHLGRRTFDRRLHA